MVVENSSMLSTVSSASSMGMVTLVSMSRADSPGSFATIVAWGMFATGMNSRDTLAVK